MKKYRIIALFCSFFLIVIIFSRAQSSSSTPPGQPTFGYGSSENYICKGYTEKRVGSGFNPWGGIWCWYYVPDKLKDRSKAPVVIYLHGMMLISPDIYKAHIEHLCRQGYIVLCPQINKGGLIGLASDNNQNAMLHRTIDSVNDALAAVGSKADRNNVIIFGHSLGGLLGMCWADNEGDAIAPQVKSIVLAEPCIHSNVPAFVDTFVNVVELDFVNKSKATTCPVIMLTGSDDTIAAPNTAVEAYNALINASSKVLYKFSSDAHGDPVLKADHMTPISDDGWMPSWAMNILGGDGEVDTFDYRVFWAALDAALDDQVFVNFDMGKWSDGTPVAPVVQVLP